MERPPSITVCKMSITASPHPPGTYEAIFSSMLGKEVAAYGDERAVIVNISKRKIGENIEILRGYIYIYTEIQRGGDWFDVVAKRPITTEEIEEIEIPENFRPNLKGTRFVFDLKKHIMYFEQRNEKKETFPVNKIKKILENLTRTDSIREAFPDVSVTILPRRDAINKVLSVPNLKKLVIRIERPNADDIEVPKARLMKKMAGMNASRQETTFTKAEGATSLTLDDETEELAAVGAVSGFVQAFGRTLQGLNIVKKTSDYPAVQIVSLDDGQDPFSAIFELIRHEYDD